jgi:hypothetical protein
MTATMLLVLRSSGQLFGGVALPLMLSPTAAAFVVPPVPTTPDSSTTTARGARHQRDALRPQQQRGRSSNIIMHTDGSPPLRSVAPTSFISFSSSMTTSATTATPLMAASSPTGTDERDVGSIQAVDQLLHRLVEPQDGDPDDVSVPGASGDRSSVIRDLIVRLASSDSNAAPPVVAGVDGQNQEDTSFDFDALLGYYNVSYTLPARPNDNPVGGRWTRGKNTKNRRPQHGRRHQQGGGLFRPLLRRIMTLGDGLWVVSRTLQHVLPPLEVASSSSSSERGPDSEQQVQIKGSTSSSPAATVAQVVNAIKLDCLWGLVCLWVVLRGDAVPLWSDQAVKRSPTTTSTTGDDDDGAATSDKDGGRTERTNRKRESPSTPPPLKLLPGLSNRAVRVYFDKPRIGIRLGRFGGGGSGTRETGRWPRLQSVLSLGPTSSVVIDTPYFDDRIRLGKGGTSGSQFVFVRVDGTADLEAVEGWRWVVSNGDTDGERPPQSSSGSGVLTQRKLLLRCALWGAMWALTYRTLSAIQPSPPARHLTGVIVAIKWIAAISTLASGTSLLWLSFSKGGIETRGGTYIRGR